MGNRNETFFEDEKSCRNLPHCEYANEVKTLNAAWKEYEKTPTEENRGRIDVIAKSLTAILQNCKLKGALAVTATNEKRLPRIKI